MTEVLLPLLLSFVAFATGYVTADYRRWSREYDAYQNAMARRRALAAVEPPNGPWSNGRAA